MTDLQQQASTLEAQAEKASHTERMRLQPQIDRVVTSLTLQGFPVSKKLQRMNNRLKDEALDDMFDNMPV